MDTRSLSPEDKEVQVKIKKQMMTDLMSDPTMSTAITKFNNPNFSLQDRAKLISPRKHSPNLTLPQIKSGLSKPSPFSARKVKFTSKT